MEIGVIADVHANEPALRAVLDDLPSVDGVVCAGDVIGYNPWPAECVDAVRQREIPTVMGNHDRMLALGRNFRGNEMARAGIGLARDRLDADQRAWLGDLPAERRLFDGRLRLVHGHPDDPDHYTFPDEFDPSLLGDERALVMGHTHIQYAEAYDEGVLLNPGSVGQPRDGDPRAAYAILDLESLRVDERRVTYDIEAVESAVHEAALPARTASRLYEGR